MKTISITIFVLLASLLSSYAQRTGRHPGDSLSRSQIRDGGALIPVLEDFDFDVYARIKSFVISYTKNDEVYETKVKGNIIPKEQTAILCKLKGGTRINFDQILVDMPDGTTRNMYTYYYVKR